MLTKRKNNVFIISLFICIAFTIWGMFPESILGNYSMGIVTKYIQDFVSNQFGWLYILLMLVVVTICIFLLFSKYGNIKLGKEEDEPQFGFVSWIAMLFSAGMGIGLVFWGVSEPLLHLYDPASPSDSMAKNARESMTYTFFHWGLQPWALYALIGLIIAYTTFRKGKPALISESVVYLFKEKYRDRVATVANVIAILATVFGVATSLGLGAQQISGGLNYLISDIPNSFLVQFSVIVVVTFLYLISATTGLDKGVKILSNANIFLAILLMLGTLLIGPTSYLLDIFIQSVGNYIQDLPKISFRMSPFDESGRVWINTWTLFYWSWWISWAPYVSSFIARISKGRTIKEFIGGVLIIPTLFTLLWFSVFGGSAIWQELFNHNHIIDIVREKGTETGLFALLGSYGGLGKVITGIAILLISTFFITSADSATFVLGMFSSKGNLVPSKRIKIIWGVIQSSIAIILLYAGGLDALQSVAVLASFPFIFIIVLMLIQFFSNLKKETGLETKQRTDL